MVDIIKLAVVLLVISMVAGLAIGFTYLKTKDKIEEQKIVKDKAALAEVFPEGVSTTEHKGNDDIPVSHWVGKKDNTVTGYAFKASSRGYSSNIEYIVGIDLTGSIVGLSILSQVETPGLGTRLVESISKKYIWNGLFAKKETIPPWFSSQFKGISAINTIAIDKSDEWHRMTDTKKQKILTENKISALTGATISTKAVSDGISRYASKFYPKFKVKYN